MSKRRVERRQKPSQKVLCGASRTFNLKTRAIPGAKQADAGAPVVLPSRPVSWGSSEEPTTRELIVYAALAVIAAGEDYSRPRHSSHSLYKSAETLANLFLPADQLVTSNQLFNYFNRAKRGDGQIGKYRGKLRTAQFRHYVTTVESACRGIFSKATEEPATVDSESICAVRSAATTAVSQWRTRCTQTTSSSTKCNFGVAEISHHVSKAERWRAVKDGEGLMLLYYGTSLGCPLCTVLVDGEKTSCKVKVHTSNMVAELKTACPEAPELLDCMDNLKTVMSIVENAVICGGCSYAKYEMWIEERLDGECFRNQSGECLARLDEPCDCTPDRCIRSVACPLLLPENGVLVCMACKDMDCTLQSGLSRHENNTPPGSRTADVHLSRADLIDTLREQAVVIKSLLAGNECLQQSQRTCRALAS